MANGILTTWWLPFGRVNEIAPATLHQQLADPQCPPQLLDVRTALEWQQGHIAGAVNAPITSLAREIDSLDLDPDRPVVAICLTAHRSIPAVRLLRRRGFRAATQLAGGMRAWRRAKLPTVRPTD